MSHQTTASAQARFESRILPLFKRRTKEVGALLPEHLPPWPYLRTTNVVESPFAAVRLRTDAAKRYKRVVNAARP